MRTFKNIHDNDQVTTIHPPDDSALALFQAFKGALQAEAELEQAMADPKLNYTGQYDPVDFYGEKEVAFNRAVNNLKAVIIDTVREDLTLHD